MVSQSGVFHIKVNRYLKVKYFIKKKFIEDIISKRKELCILPDEDYRILNMDETP